MPPTPETIRIRSSRASAAPDLRALWGTLKQTAPAPTLRLVLPAEASALAERLRVRLPWLNRAGPPRFELLDTDQRVLVAPDQAPAPLPADRVPAPAWSLQPRRGRSRELRERRRLASEPAQLDPWFRGAQVVEEFPMSLRPWPGELDGSGSTLAGAIDLVLCQRDRLAAVELKAGPSAPLEQLAQALDGWAFLQRVRPRLREMGWFPDQDLVEAPVDCLLAAERFHPALWDADRALPGPLLRHLWRAAGPRPRLYLREGPVYRCLTPIGMVL